MWIQCRYRLSFNDNKWDIVPLKETTKMCNVEVALFILLRYFLDNGKSFQRVFLSDGNIMMTITEQASHGLFLGFFDEILSLLWR